MSAAAPLYFATISSLLSNCQKETYLFALGRSLMDVDRWSTSNGRLASCLKTKVSAQGILFLCKKWECKVSPTIQQSITDKCPWNLHHFSQIKRLLSSLSQQLSLLWRQLLRGGPHVASSNQSSVILEQLTLLVNNSRSRTFLAFTMDPSIFKLAKRAGVNITQWPWPILDFFYLEENHFFTGKSYLPHNISRLCVWICTHIHLLTFGLTELKKVYRATLCLPNWR